MNLHSNADRIRDYIIKCGGKPLGETHVWLYTLNGCLFAVQDLKEHGVEVFVNCPEPGMDDTEAWILDVRRG